MYNFHFDGLLLEHQQLPILLEPLQLFLSSSDLKLNLLILLFLSNARLYVLLELQQLQRVALNYRLAFVLFLLHALYLELEVSDLLFLLSANLFDSSLLVVLESL